MLNSIKGARTRASKTVANLVKISGSQDKSCYSQFKNFKHNVIFLALFASSAGAYASCPSSGSAISSDNTVSSNCVLGSQGWLQYTGGNLSITGSGTSLGTDSSHAAVFVTGNNTGTLTIGLGAILENTQAEALYIGSPSSSPGPGALSGTLASLDNAGTIINHLQNNATSWSALTVFSGSGIGTLLNESTGTIAGGTHGAIYNAGTVTALNNNGDINGGSYAAGIYNDFGLMNSLINTGVISGNNAIYNNGTITTLNNSGTMSGANIGIYIAGGSIATLVNTGTISVSAGSSNYDIENTGTLTTLTNAQHGLTYYGTLPTNYKTYFSSGSYTPGSTFASAVFTSPYGSIASYGIQLASSGVTLAAGTYHGVLSSSSAFAVVNAGIQQTYTLNGYSVVYELLQDNVGSLYAYDLEICNSSCSSGGNGSRAAAGLTPAVVAQHNNPAYFAARVIDGNSTLSNLFSGVSGTAAQSSAASQSLPLVTGGATSVAQTALTSVNTIIDARQSANRGASSGDDFQTNRNMWLKAFGTEADQSDLDGVSGFKAHTNGVTFGADQKVNDKLTLGAAFAYASSNVSSTVGGASHGINIKGYQLIGYGSLALNQRDSVDFQLDGGMSNNSGSRDISFLNEVASSSYNSWSAHLGSSLNRRYELSDKLALTPSLRVDYTRINESGYQESGAGDLDLNVNSQRAEALVFGVDGKLDYKLSDTLALAANLGVGYDAMNKQDSIVAAYAGASSASFVTEGLNQGALVSHAGAVLSYKLPKGMEISAHYDVEGRRNYLSQTASVKFSMPF